uniref:Reverse transcriptase n=1 Tax=Tanacetum cinerariifolium TaxID=118510 RepID=A0A6L2JX37_TANCI|nr:reverse transcriptase [Tanacetum cinerariifolium]
MNKLVKGNLVSGLPSKLFKMIKPVLLVIRLAAQSLFSTVNAAGTNKVNAVGRKISIKLPFDPKMLALEDDSIFDFSSNDEDDGAVADVNNLDTTIQIEEEVYVCQLLGFEDPHFPDRVCKVKKALYGLHQAPRAWFTEVKTASTSMETQKPLIKDEDGEEVYFHMYRSMIGSLMYLTSSRLTSCLYCVPVLDTKSIQSDYAGESLDRKSITGDGKEIIIIESSVKRDLRQADEEGTDCLPDSTIFETYIDGCLSPKNTAWNEISSTMASAIICLATNQKYNFSKFIFDSIIKYFDNLFGKFLMYPRVGKGFFGKVTPLFQTMVVQNQSQLGEGSLKKDTQVPQPSDPIENVLDEAVHKELGDSLVRAAATASKLEAEQDSGNTLQSDKDSFKLDELIALCTTLQNRVLDLEKTTTTQRNEIASLKKRVKKLEKKNRGLGEDASKQGRIDAIDADKEITLVSVQDEVVSNDADNEMFDVDVFDELFDKAFKRVNTCEDFRIELVKGKEMRAGTELIQEITKKQKVEDDKEIAELKQLMEIIPDEEEVAIDVTHLSVKPPKIVD